jgi:hypothetical protein
MTTYNDEEEKVYIRDPRLGRRGSCTVTVPNPNHPMGYSTFEVEYRDYFLYFHGDQYHTGTIREVNPARLAHLPATHYDERLGFEVAIQFDNMWAVNVDGIFKSTRSSLTYAITAVRAEAIVRAVVDWATEYHSRGSLDIQKVVHDNGIDYHFRVAKTPR